MTTLAFIGSGMRRLHFGADPVRDWFALLTLVGIALVGIVVWNMWAFDTITRGGAITADATGAPPSITSVPLEKIRAIFSSRAAEEEKYRTGAYTFADPSF